MLASALILMAFMATQENSDTATPGVDDVISTMLQKDADRRTAFEGYSGIRTYVLENEAYHKRAEMTVQHRVPPGWNQRIRSSFVDRLGRRTQARILQASRSRGCGVEAGKRR